MTRIEPHDEIQVFVTGTGACVWGRIQPTSDDDGIDLQLTVRPLPATVELIRAAGVDLQPHATHVRVPRSLVDEIFGDDRYTDTNPSPMWCEFRRNGRDCKHQAVTYLAATEADAHSGWACETHATQMTEHGFWRDMRQEQAR